MRGCAEAQPVDRVVVGRRSGGGCLEEAVHLGPRPSTHCRQHSRLGFSLQYLNQEEVKLLRRCSLWSMATPALQVSALLFFFQDRYFQRDVSQSCDSLNWTSRFPSSKEAALLSWPYEALISANSNYRFNNAAVIFLARPLAGKIVLLRNIICIRRSWNVMRLGVCVTWWRDCDIFWC